MANDKRPSPDTSKHIIIFHLSSKDLERFPAGETQPTQRSKTAEPRPDALQRRTKLGRPRNTSLIAQHNTRERTRFKQEAEQNLNKNNKENARWLANSVAPLEVTSAESMEFLRMSGNTMPLSYPLAAKSVLDEGEKMMKRISATIENGKRAKQYYQRPGQEQDHSHSEYSQPVRLSRLSYRSTVPDGYGQPPDTKGRMPLTPFVPFPISSYAQEDAFLPGISARERILVGHHNTNSMAYHYDTAVRDALSSNPMYGSPDPQTNLDFSMLGLKLQRDRESNTIDPRLMLDGGMGELRERTSGAATTYGSGNAAEFTEFPPFAVNIQHVKHRRDAGNARSASRPTQGPQQERIFPFPLDNRKVQFMHDVFLANVRIAARNMADTRRGRLRYCSRVAIKSAFGERWRVDAQGPFFEDLSGPGFYQVIGDDDTQVVRQHPKLGYKRQEVLGSGIQTHQPSNGVEARYKTIDQWKEILRSGGGGLDDDQRKELGFDVLKALDEEGVRRALDLEVELFDSWEKDIGEMEDDGTAAIYGEMIVDLDQEGWDKFRTPSPQVIRPPN